MMTRKVFGAFLPIPFDQIARETTPVALSYIPVAILYGTLAQLAGLSLTQTAALSLFVYSGAAQLITVQMLAAGASHIAILIAASILTIRHVLMGASLSPFTKDLPRPAKALLSPLITDESFALAWKAYRFKERTSEVSHGYFMGTNLYLYVTWNAATIVGFFAGQFSSELARSFEVLFALLFIAILVGLTTTRLEALVAAATLLLSALLAGRIPVAWLIPLAGMTAAVVGPALERLSGRNA